MDGTRFDDLIKRLAQARLTRIDALRGLAASTAVGLAGGTLATEETDAKKKGKKSNNGKKGKKDKKGKKGGKKKGNGNNGNGNENGNEGKFLICHCPPGNPNNCHTISVGSQSAVNAHLTNHPDYEGECTTTTPQQTTTTTAQQTTTTTLQACVAPDAGFNCTVVGPVPGGTQYSCTSGATLNFSPNGWGGWSCPIGMTAISGTEDLEDQAQAFVAEPGAPMYPTYPHYIFNAAAREEGFVVQNDNDSETGRTITVQCFAPCTVSS